MPNVIPNQAVATTLVELLKDRGPLPVGYLAKLLGSPTSQIRGYLDQLSMLGTIQLYQKGDEEMAALDTGAKGATRPPEVVK